LGQGFRLKSIKLRKQLSQGLVTKLDPTMEQFGSEVYTGTGKDGWVNDKTTVFLEEGADVTEYLGVKKFEIPLSAQLAGLVRGTFPSFIQKTDQERVQNLTFHDGAEFEQVYFDGEGKEIRVNKAPRPGPCQFDYEMTMKLDGSSMTVYEKDGYIGVCSRNMDLKETSENAYWKCAQDIGLIKAMQDGNVKNIAFQGELMGPGVQDNREGFKEYHFFLFDVYDIERQCYLTPEGRAKIYLTLLEAGVNMDHVPILETNLKGKELTREKCLELAKGPSINHKVREGVVFKDLMGEYSFKAINNDYLLSEK
jgi:RNA ligase (TIGR02306 family)